MNKKFNFSNFLIVGLVRDCEKILHKEILKINKAFSGSASIKWLIIESDSVDKTVNELKNLRDKFGIKFITLGKLINKYSKRTERLAHCRNRYLEEIKLNDEYKDIDYVVVADLDGINSDLTSRAVKSCWNFDIEWDACFANQSQAYYDIFALRHNAWSPTNCMESCDFLIKNGISRYNAEYATIWSRMIKIDPLMQPIEVNSAFGGLGIYKKKVLIKGKYYGLNSQGGECCEHVSFHEQLRTMKFKLYIIPSLINCGWNEHNRKIKFINKYILKLRYLLLKIINFFIPLEKFKLLLKIKI
jgi:hypothetical protein